MAKHAVYETVCAKIGEAFEPLREAAKEASTIEMEYSGDPIHMPLSIDGDSSIGFCLEVPKTFTDREVASPGHLYEAGLGGVQTLPAVRMLAD